MEPPVSVPRLAGTARAATAAPEPPEDPPGTRSPCHGLRVAPNAEFSFDEPMANSSQLSLPRTTAPARFRRATTVASYGGTKCSRMREPAVVRIPAVQMMSLTPTGTPASGPGSSPAAMRRSMASAAARASVSLTVRNAPTRGSTAAVRASAARTSSTEDSSRRRMRTAASRTPRSCRALITGAPLRWSVDDLGHANQATVACRRVGQQRLVAGRIGHLVGSQGRPEVLDVCRGRDVGRVERLETGERVEDVVEIGGEPLLLLGREPQAGERRDPAHLVPGDRHERDLSQAPWLRNAARDDVRSKRSNTMNVGRLLQVPFTAVGLLIAGIAVPLVMGIIPPNHLYGFRSAKTLSDERTWYAANRTAGWDLVMAGLFIAAATLALAAWGRRWPARTQIVGRVLGPLGAVGLAVAHSILALGRLRAGPNRVQSHGGRRITSRPVGAVLAIVCLAIFAPPLCCSAMHITSYCYLQKIALLSADGAKRESARRPARPDACTAASLGWPWRRRGAQARGTSSRPGPATARGCAALPGARDGEGPSGDPLAARRERRPRRRTQLSRELRPWDFRLVHYALLHDHAHCVVEAADARALARGMKAIGSRLARAVNRVFGRQVQYCASASTRGCCVRRWRSGVRSRMCS